MPLAAVRITGATNARSAQESLGMEAVITAIVRQTFLVIAMEPILQSVISATLTEASRQVSAWSVARFRTMTVVAV